MSHLKERKEKICLNCGAELAGRYCHHCGQENLEPKETVWHLIQHFFNDITHFDGKFFETVKYLMRRPGFLSRQYMLGRRATYLNPIRMYVFTSAIFFLILFSLKSPADLVKMDEKPDKEVRKSLPELEKMKLALDEKAKKAGDADDRDDYREESKTLGIELAMIRKSYGDTTTRKFSKADRGLFLTRALTDSLSITGLPDAEQDSLHKEIRSGSYIKNSGPSFFGLNAGVYRTVGAYDSAESKFPDSLRDGLFKRVMMHKVIGVSEEYRADRKRYFEHFGENMLHSFPKILFFSLPFFALILNVLYFRHKQYYYVDHGIFTIHVYCATFILTLAILLLNKLSGALDWRWFSILSNILIFGIVVYMMIYLYKAMRGFYGQGRGKTFLKYGITFLLSIIINVILLALFVLISAVSI